MAGNSLQEFRGQLTIAYLSDVIDMEDYVYVELFLMAKVTSKISVEILQVYCLNPRSTSRDMVHFMLS